MLHKQIKIFDDVVEFCLIYADRKTVSLSVLPSGAVLLKSPKNISEERLNNFVKKKYFWLKKQIKEVNKYKQAKQDDNFISGAKVLYCGRQYMLKVHEYQTQQKVVLEKGVIHLYSFASRKDVKHTKALLEDWYKEKAVKIFTQELKKMCLIFKEELPPLKIRQMKKRWGSCSPKGVVTLNPELIKASKTCIDYVIAHELCHLKYRKHDANFYTLLSAKFPNWKKTKEKLELRFV